MTLELGTTDINKLYLGTTEIKKAYLGSTFVYDKTGAPSFSPSDISNLVKWHDATDVISGTEPSNADPVDTWQDLGASSFDFDQQTGTRQPEYQTNIQNSKPGIYFDGTSDNMKSSFGSYSQPCTYVFIINPDSGSDNLFFTSTSGSQHAAIESGGNVKLFAGSVADTGISYPTTASILFLFFDTSGTGSYARINGVDGTKYINPGTQGTSGDFWLGTNTTGTGNYFKGYMFEIIAYNKLLNATEIGQIESYSNSKWGI